ncbi:bifunctional adenosylcobinamide kinase/adenosylcobinamide-phosphate guanylyltransferase [Chloroflexota bacterium]
MGRLTFILGGARSGKSTYAEKLASLYGGKVVYIATAQALDEEMETRIKAHQAQRPEAWQTLEISRHVASELAKNPPKADTILLDCLTLLISNLLMDACQDADKPDEALSRELAASEIKALLDSIQSGSADWIVVSNEVGMGLVPPYPLGRLYRDLLGWANQQIAGQAAKVLIMIAGIPWQLTPEEDGNGGRG